MTNYNIYWAGPLFTQAQLDFNSKCSTNLSCANLRVYLPQEEGIGANEALYVKDIQAIKNSDLVVAVLDGSDVDSGTAFEIGYATALGMDVIGLCTDLRVNNVDRAINLVVLKSCVRIFKDFDSLRDFLIKHF